MRIHHPVMLAPLPIEAAENIPWKNRPDTALFFGRLSPEKGVDVLLRTFALLPEKKLEIVGFGPDESYLKKLTADLGIEERVNLLSGVNTEKPLRNASIIQRQLLCQPYGTKISHSFLWIRSNQIRQSLHPILADSHIIRDGENGFLFGRL